MGMFSIFEYVFDIILPPRARTARTKARTLEAIPLSPMSHDTLGVRITTLMEYQNIAVEDLIRSLKYDGSSHAVNLAAEALSDYLREEISSSRTFSARKIILVPMPLHKSRERERGWNQIELVLKALPQEFHGSLAEFAPKALVRSRSTRPQTRLSRSERLSNVSGAFVVADKSLICDAHVFLIDDVTTTGATLANAATVLRRAGAKVTLIALARA
ncbi:MAG: hypothetical protein AAB798_00065 [Patescibacteria group bacterium]